MRTPSPPSAGRRPGRRATGLALLALAGCAPLGVIGDGSSVSGGQPNRGWLLDARRLPDRGDGYLTHATWRARGLRFGTDEMLALLTQAAASIATTNAPVRLGIGDLSFEGGGPAAPHHRSHQSGRDADLFLYLIDAAGRPYESTTMRALGDDGVALDGSGERLDVARTWQLVRALVTSPQRNVQYLFLYEPLSQLLLDHARAAAEPPWLLELARQALLEPSGAPHADHLHVRVYCSPMDEQVGCRDFGNLALRDKRLDTARLLQSLHAQVLEHLPVAGSGLLAWRLTAPDERAATLDASETGAVSSGAR
ncbi:MAG: penicillin-insensitive murein endopeptidase [Kofleriaceae bacterium]